MWNRLRSLIRKEFIQIIRDPRTLALVLIMPVMQLFLLGYAAQTDVRDVPLAVLDQDRSRESRALLDAYRAADYFRFSYDLTSENQLRSLIEDGQARVGLIIPPDYSERITSGQQAEVALILDGSDPSVASTALSAAQMIGQAHATKIMQRRLASLGQGGAVQIPLDVRTRVWYNPDLISSYFMIPGVIAVVLYALTSILTATTLVRERERGTIEQLIVTPIRPLELIIGKLLPYVILAFAILLEVLAIGHYYFRVPVRGDLGLILLLSGLFLISSLGTGLLASTFANTQQEAMLLVWFTLLPGIFLSGFFFPLEAMPPVLDLLSRLTPIRYFMIIIRALMLKDISAAALRGEIIALAVFGAGLMTLAAVRFRKRLD